jgi:predicted RNase H-like HicB family nuclease
MITTALIEKSEDGTYSIYTPDIKSTIIGSGKTVKEAKTDFENSVKDLTEMFNGELPGELNNITFEYKYDLASIFNYLNWLNITMVAQKIGIEPSLMNSYCNKNTYISEKQVATIKNGFHKLASELSFFLM